ncbi:family 20 glycosylhydrolase, partial [Salmonella enterica]|uniref:family 20 glycosylhydrolase n=1 Tax=Salmonella enterica TaxID=28901 RepID=UPI003CEB94E6
HGETIRIQEKIYPWEKNSIHLENGEGSYITQDEVREIVEYCRYRGMEVIPEVPLMSHSDYILAAYPELNEREEDKYP